MSDRSPGEAVSHESSGDFYATQDRHARRCYWEARVAAVIWLVACLYCCSVMGFWGYVPPADRPDEPSLIMGFPSWVFIGLVVPWVVLIGVIWGFARWILRDDEALYEFPPSEGRSRGQDATGTLPSQDPRCGSTDRGS